MKPAVLLLLFVYVMGCSCMAATHYVDINGLSPSAPYASWAGAATNIQDAVDVAADGDTVWVADGHYLIESQIELSSNIVLRSVNGPQFTVIDANNTGRCIRMGRSSSQLIGFTLIRGDATVYGAGYSYGGGVAMAYGVVSNCVVTACEGVDGGGICGGLVVDSLICSNRASCGGGIHDADAQNCILEGNDAYNDGGGVSGYTYNDHYLHNCLIVGNHGRRNGGGIYGYRMTIVNCTIVNNTVEYYGGGVYRGALVNSIVFGNTSENEGNNYQAASAKNCCCPDLTAGVDGNITNSPTFVSGYYPASDSPCIDAGGNTNVATAFDLDRNLRIQSGTVDMGAYEWQEAPRLACSLGGTIIKQVAGLHTLDPIALDVWNSGAGSLTYTLSENSDWMSLSQTSGSSSGGRQTIVLNFDTDELPVGTYAGEISIRSDEASNDPIEIGIIVDVFDDFDHFEIGTIPSPRPAGIPFPVNIYACNASNETVGLFNDSVGLSAMADCIVEGPTNLLGDTESGDTFSRDDTVYGLSFTPSTDIIVTHVSRLFGREVAIWEGKTEPLVRVDFGLDSGGSWKEKALDSPLRLSAGTTYVISSYIKYSATIQGVFGYSTPFAHGTINRGVQSMSGNEYPNAWCNVRWLVDFKYQPVERVTLPISKNRTEDFIGGTWNGLLSVSNEVLYVILTMEDEQGNTVESNPFDVADYRTDSDSDGLFDYWEMTYYTNLASCSGEADDDGDGDSNLQECIADSDPTDSFSGLLVGGGKRTANGYIVEWSPLPGRVYDVLWYPSINSSSSVELSTGMVFPQNSFTDTVYSAEAQGFYRIRASFAP